MFQYAYARALKFSGKKVKIDISAFNNYKIHGGYHLDVFNIDIESSTKKENKKFFHENLFLNFFKKLGINFHSKIKEKNLMFNQSLLFLKDNQYVEGYFQNEKYFKNIRDLLISQFVTQHELSSFSKSIIEIIKAHKNTCSIHIRRGDYLDVHNNSIHGVCNLGYYEKAIFEIDKNYNKTKFFVFSDDIKWCKKNLKFKNLIFVSSNEIRIPHEDIHLMSFCKHNIISNSTYGWWGAWLNQNENKRVIAPSRWFENDKLEKQSKFIVCDNWLRL